MTCIIGYVDKDKNIWMAADSAAVSNGDIRIRKDKKIFTNGDFIFGFSGSFRMGQLLRYAWVQPHKDEDMDDETFIHHHVVNSFIRLFKNNSLLNDHENELKSDKFLFGYNSKLYMCECDFQITQNIMPNEKWYDAIGSGEDYALGAINTYIRCVDSDEEDIEAMLNNALMTAAYFSRNVVEPFNYLKMEHKNG